MFSDVPDDRSDRLTTVFPIGQLVLTADVPVSGIPAGENLADICLGTLESYASTQSLDNLTLSIDDGSQLYSDLLANGCLGTSVSSTITLDAPSSLEKGITFTLSVPVRRVLFLEWLNLLQSNPEAGIPYKDEILTGSGKWGPYYKDGDVLRFPA